MLLSASAAPEDEEKGTEVGGAETADPLLGATDSLQGEGREKKREG